MTASATIAVLGASGLIGEAVCRSLASQGFAVRAIARRFTPAQAAHMAEPREADFVNLTSADLARLLDGADVVVNCVGVLQDSATSDTDDVHTGFVARLLEALEGRDDRPLLVHISMPGEPRDDRTSFARTKRAAEALLANGAVAHVILRPGFVLAPAAFGGSALLRALAVLPFDLPEALRNRPFAVTAVDDIARTVAHLAEARHAGEADARETWDVLSREPSTIGDVLDGLRRHLGGPRARIALPSWCLSLGATAGDLASHLGWRPPVRTTALAELRRGVTGDPAPWRAATGLTPASLPDALDPIAANVQEKWFARLYLLKALSLVTLAVFWIVSGLIALTIAFPAATAILTDHGVPHGLAAAITVASSLMDIGVGAAIAFRRTCRLGLLAGVAVSLFYMAGAAVLTPDMWVEPLGALVKTGPAIVLMLITLAMLDER